MITKEYRKELLDIHANTDWGVTGGVYCGDSVIEFIKAFPVKTILDYGCGEGSLKKWVEDAGITDLEWTQYDPGMPEFQKRPEGTFDLVVTTDVLEHVEDDMLDAVIDDLYSFTGKYIYNAIACYLARATFADGPYKGQDLHLSLKAPDEWMLRLARPYMGVISSHACVHYGWKVRYLSTQERIGK